MIRNFLKKNEGQALIETILFFTFIGTMIMIFLINTGFIQIVRLRLSMANRFMVYTATHAVRPNAGRKLKDKVRLMLGNGPPVISDKKKHFNNLNIFYRKKSAIFGLDLPFVPKNVEGKIDVDYNFNSSIMQKITGRRKIKLSSGKIVMYRDFLYKDIISLSTLKDFLGYTE